MDAAFIAIADQMTLPRGTIARRVGDDELVLFVPPGARPPGRGRKPLKDRPIAFSTYDRGAEEIHARLISLGALPCRGVTLGTTVAMARHRGHLALVPRTALATELRPGEHLTPAPFRYRLTLTVVTTPTHPSPSSATSPDYARR